VQAKAGASQRRTARALAAADGLLGLAFPAVTFVLDQLRQRPAEVWTNPRLSAS
jgi:hypothetical protein